MEKELIGKKTETSQLRIGDKLSRTSYMTILGRNIKGFIVKNEAGFEWTIDEGVIAEECYSADQFNETKEITRTELIEIFSKTGDAIYTVNFNKQPKVEEVFDEIANKGKLISNSDMKKKLKEGMKGEPRTLVGYTVKVETGFGRSQVVDLEVPQGQHNIRQVDHRTLNFLILKNIKYIVK